MKEKRRFSKRFKELFYFPLIEHVNAMEKDDDTWRKVDCKGFKGMRPDHHLDAIKTKSENK